MYMHLHICLRKRSHYDATVIKPDRNQLVYTKNVYYNFHRSKRNENMSMQYTAIFNGCEYSNFQMKKNGFFLIFAQNIDRGF